MIAAPDAPSDPSPLAGEGGARSHCEWEGEGAIPSHETLLARSRWMRAHPTEAERRLWSILRDRRLVGLKFKRQQIIVPYIVDFVCLERRFIVEADGSQHADDPGDVRRDRFLNIQDFRVLRFWNNDILGRTGQVADAIFAALSPPHPPTAARRVPPSPARGEGFGAANA